jgi:hypothetical protein
MISYDIRGKFYEACDCEVICPCWAGLPPDMGTCTGIFAWHIFEGTIDGIDVRNSKVVVLSSGKSCDESKYMLVLIDGLHPKKLQDAFEKDGPWKEVFSLQPMPTDVKQRTTQSATITIVGNHITAKITGETVAEVTSIDKPVYLKSTGSDLLIDRVVKDASNKFVQVGVVSSPTAQAPSKNGLNLLADILDPLDPLKKPLYTFDLDISRVTAMRGHFRYKHR